MDEFTARAALCYTIISKKANNNAVAQGVTGIFGFPVTLVADVGVIPGIYVPLWNEIRNVYGLQPIDSGDGWTVIKNILQEVLMDLVMDKFLGNIPLIGMYFNAICAKHMTWRLGTLFSMLSARGDEVVSSNASGCMKLIRNCFPQEHALTFTTPDKADFIRLVTSLTDISTTEFKSKINKGLAAME